MKRNNLCKLAFGTLLAGLLTAVPVSAESTNPEYESAIPMLHAEMMSPDFWIQCNGNSDQVLLTPEEMQEFNRRSFAKASVLADVSAMPDSLSGTELREMITSSSVLPETPRFHLDGAAFTAAEIAAWQENLNLDAIQENNPVEFALITRRGMMRRFPTFDEVRDSDLDAEIDSFDETGCFPGEAAAILHRSKDNQWAFVQRYNYRAWMPLEILAVGDRESVKNYRNSKDFLVITGAKVYTANVGRATEHRKQINELQLDMGLRFPYLPAFKGAVDTIDASGNYVIQLPLRNADGTLSIEPALISRSADVSINAYLPYTVGNIIRQSFKFLGERYGWGDANNARDCSGLVLSVYSSMGMLMARNSSEQEFQMAGVEYNFKNLDLEQCREQFQKLVPGDLLFTPTHVMIYLGTHEGEPYIIHDTLGIWCDDEEGNITRVPANSVTVTPFNHFYANGAGKPFLRALRTAKHFELTGDTAEK